MDYRNFRVVLSRMALFFTDGARRDLSRLNSSFCFCPWPFLGGVVRVQVWWLVFVGRVEDETRSQWVAQGLRLPSALVVEMVDKDTTREFPM